MIIRINRREFTLTFDSLTEAELRSLGSIPDEHEIWETVWGCDEKVSGESIPIRNGSRFFSSPRIINNSSSTGAAMNQEQVLDVWARETMRYAMNVGREEFGVPSRSDLLALISAARQPRILTGSDPEPAIGSVVRTVGGWEAPDASAVAHRWPNGWYVAGSSRLYDWPHVFVGWDNVHLVHDAGDEGK